MNFGQVKSNTALLCLAQMLPVNQIRELACVVPQIVVLSNCRKIKLQRMYVTAHRSNDTLFLLEEGSCSAAAKLDSFINIGPVMCERLSIVNCIEFPRQFVFRSHYLRFCAMHLSMLPLIDEYTEHLCIDAVGVESDPSSWSFPGAYFRPKQSEISLKAIFDRLRAPVEEVLLPVTQFSDESESLIILSSYCRRFKSLTTNWFPKITFRFLTIFELRNFLRKQAEQLPHLCLPGQLRLHVEQRTAQLADDIVADIIALIKIHCSQIWLRADPLTRKQRAGMPLRVDVPIGHEQLRSLFFERKILSREERLLNRELYLQI